MSVNRSVTGRGSMVMLLAALLGLVGQTGCDDPSPPVAFYATAAAQSGPATAATVTPATSAGPGASATLTPTAGAPLASPVAALPSAPAPTPQPDPTPTGAPAAEPFDPSALAGHMLDLINRDRAAAGLGPVAWDDTAAVAAQAHATDMVARGFFSHWNPDGLGPDHRYTAAGGTQVARENLYAFSLAFTDGRGAPIDDWPAVIDRAQAELMNSPGHRANILDPSHTHVGIGLAYDAGLGQFRLAQEFTNWHVALATPLPLAASPGDVLRIAGAFGPGAVGGGILALAYEPFPVALSAADLASRSTYHSAAQDVGPGRSVGLMFDETLTLPAAPGYYHVRLFVDLAGGQALVMDHVSAVR